MLETPVLFLIFNRPDTTQKVFEEIKKAKPTRFYLAADGPRVSISGEIEKCNQVKEIVLKNIDWKCETHTLFRDKNLGCGKAISQAITWFFEHEEQGIILEDDCLPDFSFFSYAEQLLNYYEKESSVMLISGNNFQQGNKRGNASYYFSKFPNVWGWATWKRAWILYEFSIAELNDPKTAYLMDSILPDKVQRKFWLGYFKSIVENKIDTWDIQLTYSIWKNNGVCVSPNQNLVTNIGFHEINSTHTRNSFSSNSSIKTTSIYQISHPADIIVDREADNYTFYNAYHLPNNNIWRRVKNFLSMLIKNATL